MQGSLESQEREVRETEADREAMTGPIPRFGRDRFAYRWRIALALSLVVNALLWVNLSHLLNYHVVRELPPITFKRIVLPPPPKPQPTPPPPKPQPTPPPQVRPKLVQHLTKQQPQPQQHSNVLVASKPGLGTGSALAGGTAPIGQPIQSQQPTVVAPPAPTVVPQPTVAPTPISTPVPIPAPTPTPGPTEAAQATYQPYPDIPDELKNDDYKSYVRVIVTIGSDGSTTGVTLVTSSGDEDIDGRVIEALKQWKWKPALKDGIPVASSLRFRFDFEVD